MVCHRGLNRTRVVDQRKEPSDPGRSTAQGRVKVLRLAAQGDMSLKSNPILGVDVASATLVVYAFTSPRSDGHLPFRQGVRLRCNHMRSWNWWQNCHRNLRKNCGAELGLPFPVFALGKHGGVRGVVPPYHCKSYPCRLSRCYLTRDATPAARRRGRSACCGPFSFPTRYDARLSP
jgi:hypothetical protein